MARMRALETGREMIRATNTGVSAIIGADGGLRRMGPLFEAAVLTATVQPYQGTTPYGRAGDWPLVGLVLAGMGGLLLRRRRR